MFDMFKQFQQLKKMQEAMQRARITVERNGVTVTLDGTMHVESITLNPELAAEAQAALVRDCINEAMKKIQTQLAQEMSQGQ